MRLIDADKLLKQLEWLDTDDFILYEEVKKDIDEMPTVKAILIEWIEKYKRVRGWEVTVTTQNAIDNMLNAWEKENENRVEQ